MPFMAGSLHLPGTFSAQTAKVFALSALPFLCPLTKESRYIVFTSILCFASFMMRVTYLHFCLKLYQYKTSLWLLTCHEHGSRYSLQEGQGREIHPCGQAERVD